MIDRPVDIRMEDLGAGDVMLNVSFWSDSRRSDVQDTCPAVRTYLLRTMPRAGISFPAPDLRRLAPADISRWRAILKGDDPKSWSREAGDEFTVKAKRLGTTWTSASRQRPAASSIPAAEERAARATASAK